MSVIEVSNLPKGNYHMQIAIPRSHWFPNKGFETCLPFDLVIEFIPQDPHYDEDLQFTELGGPVTILNVFPPSRENLRLGSELHMHIHLSRPIDVHDAAMRNPDLGRLCVLRSMAMP